MVRRSLLAVLTVSLMLCLPQTDSWGRGFGGGGGARRRGRRLRRGSWAAVASVVDAGGVGGGGFGGGAGRGPGGFGGGGVWWRRGRESGWIWRRRAGWSRLRRPGWWPGAGAGGGRWTRRFRRPQAARAVSARAGWAGSAAPVQQGRVATASRLPAEVNSTASWVCPPTKDFTAPARSGVGLRNVGVGGAAGIGGGRRGVWCRGVGGRRGVGGAGVGWRCGGAWVAAAGGDR